MLTEYSLITINHDWRVIYEVAAAFVGLVLLLAFFTFPETAYKRDDTKSYATTTILCEKPGSAGSDVEINSLPVVRNKAPYIQSLKIFNKILTKESMLTMFLRPLGLIVLPPVLWAALVQSVTIGFLGNIPLQP